MDVLAGGHTGESSHQKCAPAVHGRI